MKDDKVILHEQQGQLIFELANGRPLELHVVTSHLQGGAVMTQIRAYEHTGAITKQMLNFMTVKDFRVWKNGVGQ